MKRSTKIGLCALFSFLVILSAFLVVRINQLQKEVNELKNAALLMEHSKPEPTEAEETSISTEPTEPEQEPTEDPQKTMDRGTGSPYSKQGPSIVADHYAWYSLFSGKDYTNPEYTVKKIDDGTSAFQMEDMTVIYDVNTLYAKSASYVFLPSDLPEDLPDSEKMSRYYHMLSFFASIEYDGLFDYDHSEYQKILNEMKGIYQKMMDAINAEYLTVECNSMVPFYEGKYGTYSFYVTDDLDIVISLVVS